MVTKPRSGNRNGRRPTADERRDDDGKRRRQRRRLKRRKDDEETRVRENPKRGLESVRGGGFRGCDAKTWRRPSGASETTLYGRRRYRRELSAPSRDEATRGGIRVKITKLRRKFSERVRDGKHGDVRVGQAVGKERQERRVHIFRRGWSVEREGEERASVFTGGVVRVSRNDVSRRRFCWGGTNGAATDAVGGFYFERDG